MHKYKTIIDVIKMWALMSPQKVAYTILDYSTDFLETNISYQQLLIDIKTVAYHLQNHPTRCRYALLCFAQHESYEFIKSFYGCLAAGVIAVPLYPPRSQRLDLIKTIMMSLNPELILTSMQTGKLFSMQQDPLFSVAQNKLFFTDQLTKNDQCDITPSNIAFLQYTSGSTSIPKGVIISHENILANQEMMKEAFAHDQTSDFVGWPPLHHDLGLICNMMQPIYNGARSIMLSPTDFFQKPMRWLSAISQYRARTSGAPNFAYQLCCDEYDEASLIDCDLSEWRVAFIGAEPIHKETLEQFVNIFSSYGFKSRSFYPAYGLAEATLFVCGANSGEGALLTEFNKDSLGENKILLANKSGTDEKTALVSSGYINRHHNVKIVNPSTRKICSELELGEIAIMGLNVSQGYIGSIGLAEDGFNSLLINEKPLNFLTGDLGFIYQNNLYITGRCKDLIIICGRNYYPNDIEIVAKKAHPSLSKNQAAAFEINSGEKAGFVIAIEIDRDFRKYNVNRIKEDLMRHVTQQIGLRPLEVLIVRYRSLPLTTSGKIRRSLVKQCYLQGELKEITSKAKSINQKKIDQDDLWTLLTALAPEERFSALKQYLGDMVKAILGIPKANIIDEKKGFIEMGLNSMMAIELKNRLQVSLKKTAILSSTVVFDQPNLEKITNYIAGLLKLENLSAHNHEQSAMPTLLDEPIAVIGMSCRFPGGANNTESYWKLLEQGQDAITEVPAIRWDADYYYNSDPQAPGKMITKFGGFLDADVSEFDAAFFGVNPKEAKYMDPQQRLLLEVSYEAIQSSGIDPGSLRGSSTGVFVGISSRDYMDLLMAGDDKSSIHPYMTMGNTASMASGRISYFFGFHGPNIAIDTACSSSLVAIDQACQSLRAGDANLALAGGVNLILSPDITISFSRAGMLAKDGRCKSFDARADGYVRGEGCGVIVLKRLSDAKRDQDPILAVIKSSGINQDGASSGLTVPNGDAQEALIRKVLSKSKLKASDIDYVEAHGTGTSLGDPIEIRALAAVYGEREPSRPLKLGSVKTNIGHLEAAAGMASVIKVILALRHETLPAHLHFTKLNPKIELNFPSEIVTKKIAWKRGDQIRRAAVSSFGFSGTNAHLILEEAISKDFSDTSSGPYLLIFSAKCLKALQQKIIQLKCYLGEHIDCNMADVSYTLQMGQSEFNYRTFLVCESVSNAIAQLSVLNKYKKSSTQTQGLFQFTPELLEKSSGEKLLGIVGRAWVNGQAIDWSSYYVGQVRRRLALPTYPFVRKSYWADKMDRHKICGVKG